MKNQKEDESEETGGIRQSPIETLFTPQEVADIFGVTRVTVYCWIRRAREGESDAGIGHFKVGKHVRIPASAIKAKAREVKINARKKA